MIHFDCQHCGKPVRVPDAHAGKKGRCPSCHEVVSIPLEDDAIAAMASVMEGEPEPPEEKTVVGYVPPPPVSQPRHEEDPLQPAEAGDDLDDTVILPAEAAAKLDTIDEEPIPRPRSRHHRPAARPRVLTPRRTFLIVAVTIMLLAAAVITVLLVMHLQGDF